MIQSCLGSRLTEGGEIVSLKSWPRSIPQKYFYFCVWYSFLLEAEYIPDPSAVGRIG
jgi:hypothetical protein